MYIPNTCKDLVNILNNVFLSVDKHPIETKHVILSEIILAKYLMDGHYTIHIYIIIFVCMNTVSFSPNADSLIKDMGHEGGTKCCGPS